MFFRRALSDEEKMLDGLISAADRLLKVDQKLLEMSKQFEREVRYTVNDAQVDRDLAKLWEEDETSLISVKKGWKPIFHRTTANGGLTFLKYENEEFCLNYVADIFCSEPGTAPYKEYSHASSFYYGFATRKLSVVQVNMNTGRTIQFLVNRHKAEVLLDELRRAWKEHG